MKRICDGLEQDRIAAGVRIYMIGRSNDEVHSNGRKAFRSEL